MTGLPQQQSTVNMQAMEEALARQLANQRVTDERRRREIEKLCGESDELKELQAKIKAAYLNKERSQQMTEKQYRMQQDIEEDAQIDITMIKNKELSDQNERAANNRKLQELVWNKAEIQKQIADAELLRQQAHEEYMKEKNQVDAVVQRMIEEDNESARIVQQKKE